MSTREVMRQACIDLTRLADELGWDWTLDSSVVAAGRVVLEVRLHEPIVNTTQERTPEATESTESDETPSQDLGGV